MTTLSEAHGRPKRLWPADAGVLILVLLSACQPGSGAGGARPRADAAGQAGSALVALDAKQWSTADRVIFDLAQARRIAASIRARFSVHDTDCAQPTVVRDLPLEPSGTAWAATLPERGSGQQAVVLVDGCAPLSVPSSPASDTVFAPEPAPERSLLLFSEDKGIQQRLSPPVMYLLDAARAG